jgi:chromosome segregation ATPase
MRYIEVGEKRIAIIAAYEFYNCTIEEANANAERIVECVNACNKAPIQTIELAELHREACVTWEREMKKAIGEDGVGSVVEAIRKLKAENEALREHVNELFEDKEVLEKNLTSLQETNIRMHGTIRELRDAMTLAISCKSWFAAPIKKILNMGLAMAGFHKN